MSTLSITFLLSTIIARHLVGFNGNQNLSDHNFKQSRPLWILLCPPHLPQVIYTLKVLSNEIGK